jgi:membrane associated rhomboid family serine protease
VCSQCGALNSIEDKTCYRCGKRAAGPLGSSAQGLLSDFSADGVPVTKLMALMCIVVYALMVISDGGFKLEFSVIGSFKASSLLRLGALHEAVTGEPWRMLAAVFVHFGLLHIGLNLMSLVSLGRTLEPHFGSARFLILYVSTGVLGFAATLWWWDFSASPVVRVTAGASGAVFGLVGAFVGVLMARRSPNWKRVLVNNLIYCAILGFVLPANNAAHLGGFVAGIVIGALFERERQPHRREALMRAVAGVCLLASVGSVVLSAQSPSWKLARQVEEARRLRYDSE